MVRRGLTLALVAFPALGIAAEFGLPFDGEIGRALFERSWVSAPSSTNANDGLGPLFDASSCQGCHVPAGTVIRDATPPGMIIRLGNARGESDPVYGAQMQTRGLQNIPAEALPDISWQMDGNLRETVLTLHRIGYGPLDEETLVGLRRPLTVRGAGLLAAVPESDILSRVSDNAEGVSGRAAWIEDRGGMRRLGRFGWKATEPDLGSQIDIAFSRDLGLSTEGHPDSSGECTASQNACRDAPHGAETGEVEIGPEITALIEDFLRTAPPPVPRSSSPEGEALFVQTGCGACHAVLRLEDGTEVRAYTDLLLHDMGEDLNDGIAEGAALPGEWRTPPLWGLSATVQLGGLMHDARAPNVEEAIEWHGGEAAAARARFRALEPDDKAALLAFVNGL